VDSVSPQTKKLKKENYIIAGILYHLALLHIWPFLSLQNLVQKTERPITLTRETFHIMKRSIISINKTEERNKASVLQQKDIP
jgi:hypothetical protein